MGAGVIALRLHVTLRWTGLRAPDLRPAMRQGMLVALEAIHRRALGNLGGLLAERRTGQLADSVDATLQEFPWGVRGTLGTSLFYGRFLEFGTKPHVIARFLTRKGTHRRIGGRRRGRLAPKRPLRLTVGGRTLFRLIVNHPGVLPRHWLRRAAESAQPEVLTAFQTAVTAAIARQGHGRIAA